MRPERRDDDLADVRRRLEKAAAATAGVFAVGVVGYAIIGRGTHSFIDALYMTVITLTTVGYGEIIPLDHSPGGRIFTISLLLAGVGVLVYFTSTVTAFFVEGHLTRAFWRNRMRKAIDQLSGHFIVCGAGGVADHVVAELRRVGRSVVVVAPPESVISSQDAEVLWVTGDPSDEAILSEAGILRATGLVAALESDHANIVATLAAREAHAELRIVAMVTDTRNAPKFRRAGADEIVSPTSIGGLRMASVLIRPTVVTFLDAMLRDRDRQLSIDEVVISPGSPVVGARIGTLAINAQPGLLLLAVVEPDGETHHFKPEEDRLLQSGATIIVMGGPAAVARLRERCGSGSPSDAGTLSTPR